MRVRKWHLRKNPMKISFSSISKSISESQLTLILSVLVGVITGCAAVLLRELIHIVGNFVWGTLTTGILAWVKFIAPAVGMLLSLLIVRYLVRDNIGHGVTRVLKAVSRNNSNIKPHNTWSSLLTSALTISFGGSVGAEAPIVYTGAAIGSNIGRKAGLSYKNITILLGCGAAAAVAGIFKAPMAGVLFTLEILLFNISMSSIIPLLISSVTAAAISYLHQGRAVTFAAGIEDYMLGNIPYYILLGLVGGFMSLYFIRSTLSLEDRLKKYKNPYLRWLICSVGLCSLIFLFPPLFGEGYEPLGQVLAGKPSEMLSSKMVFGSLTEYKWFVPIFFTAVMFLKVPAMSFTNAGGGVGGTFGPTLIVGGMAGFVFSRIINLSGFHALPESNFALVGMAALMAGVMQAPMTAIFLIAEITGGYSLLFPLIIASVVSYATIRVFEPYSIYSKRLAVAGDLLTHDSDQAVLTLLNTGDFVEKDFETVGVNDTLGVLVDRVSHCKRNLFPVIDDKGHICGVISLDDIREVMFNQDLYNALCVYNLMREVPVIVEVHEHMDSVMEKFEQSGAWNLPVVDEDSRYLGFISKSKIFSSYRERLHQVSSE